MPRNDGTGPVGAGAMTGKGLGSCSGVNASIPGAGFGWGAGLGFGYRRGFGRGFGRGYNGYVINQDSPKTQKELLEQQKTILQSRLEVIDQELDNL